MTQRLLKCFQFVEPEASQLAVILERLGSGQRQVAASELPKEMLVTVLLKISSF